MASSVEMFRWRISKILESRALKAESLQYALEWIIDNGGIADVVRSLMQGSGEPSDFYWHSNGYFQLSLIENRPQFALRLHHWPKGHGGDRSSLIHDHPWNYCSKMITGSYFEERYATGLGDPFSVSRVEFDPGLNEYKITPEGRGWLSKMSEEEIGCGSFSNREYVCPHRIWKRKEKEAMTLILVGKYERRFSFVYRNDMAIDGIAKKKRVGLGERNDTLSFFLKSL